MQQQGSQPKERPEITAGRSRAAREAMRQADEEIRREELRDSEKSEQARRASMAQSVMNSLARRPQIDSKYSKKESARRERAEARRAGRATETARVAEARRKKEANKCVAEAQRESAKSRREKARAVSVQKAAEDKARQSETVWEAEYHQACTLARAPQWEHA